MKKLVLAVVSWLLVGGAATAGDLPLPGCLHCKASQIHKWMSGVGAGSGYHRHTCGVMDGNCAFGPCGEQRVPGPWYTYWPYHGPNLTSPYAVPNWTYEHHFQTAAPLGGGHWHTPDSFTNGFGGIPYYWSGR